MKKKIKAPDDHPPAAFTFVDICCGIGAFHHSLKRLGGKCVMACDKSEQSRQTYESNHGVTPWHEDIYTLDKLPPHDVFCAGFPCTTFSLAGLRKGTRDKDAGGIIFKLMDLVKESLPPVIILENVPGLTSIHGGKTLKYIVKTLTGFGYEVDYRVHDAYDYGAPMHRQRLIISATRGYSMFPECEARKIHNRQLQIKDIAIANDKIDKSYFVAQDRYVVMPKDKWYTHEGKTFIGYITAVKYDVDDLTKISAHSQALKIYHEDSSSDNFTSTNRYAFMIDGRVRYLVPREMYSCMGFPKSFKLYDGLPSVQVRQLTNSINIFMLVPVCEWIVMPFLRLGKMK